MVPPPPQLKGVEKIEWEEHWQERVHDGTNEDGTARYRQEHREAKYDGKETFFKHKVKITGRDQFIPPGMYSFPFRVQLPTVGKRGNKLSGSFKLKQGHPYGWSGARGQVKHLKAKIEYSLKAVVDLV